MPLRAPLGIPSVLLMAFWSGIFFQGKAWLLIMSKVEIELEMPDDLARFRLPAGVNARLQELLGRQDNGVSL